MKQLLFLVLLNMISTQAFSQTVADCKKFEADVLVKAVIPDTDPSEFVKDEKAALAFINQYDFKKLILTEVKNTIKESRKEFIANNCHPKSKKPLPFCESYGFSNYMFIQGLTTGMKNNKWKPETIRLGKQKIWDYMQEISKLGGVSSLSLMTATTNIAELIEAKLITGINSQTARMLVADMEKEGELYAKAIGAEKDPKKKCDIDKKYSTMEDDLLAKYNPRFTALIAQWKRP
jgi:hypothetical protein